MAGRSVRVDVRIGCCTNAVRRRRDHGRPLRGRRAARWPMRAPRRVDCSLRALVMAPWAVTGGRLHVVCVLILHHRIRAGRAPGVAAQSRRGVRPGVRSASCPGRGQRESWRREIGAPVERGSGLNRSAGSSWRSRIGTAATSTSAMSAVAACSCSDLLRGRARRRRRCGCSRASSRASPTRVSISSWRMASGRSRVRHPEAPRLEARSKATTCSSSCRVRTS